MPAVSTVNLCTTLDLASVKSTSATSYQDRAFLPAGRSPEGVQRLEYRVGGIPVGYPVISFSTRRPTATSRLYKVTAKLQLPTLEVVGVADSGYQAANKKAYEHMATLEIMLPERGTLAQRSEFYSILASMFFTTISASDSDPTGITGSPLKALVVDLDTIYG